jgi:plasmid segregation protein ParM
MKVGIDIGYSAVKVRSNIIRSTFPSVVGTPERARFSVHGSSSAMILDIPDTGKYLVGSGAVEQSRMIKRREDRQWIYSQEYYTLMIAAMVTLSEQLTPKLSVVTGLPVAFYSDREELRRRFQAGEHRVTMDGRSTQSFEILECRVVPQPFGALLNEVLDDEGNIADAALAEGKVGVIDCGGKTTNLLSVHRLAERVRETASVNMGGWDIVRAIRMVLQEEVPELDLRDHEIINAVINGHVEYYGKTHDLEKQIDAIVVPMAEQVIAEASQMWNGGANLSQILITGGSALLLGKFLLKHFQHAYIVEDPVFGNVNGFYKFAQRLSND